MWTVFRNKITKIVEEYVPKRKEPNKSKRKSPWIAKETKKKMKERAAAWKKYTIYQSDQNYRKYKTVRNEVNKLVKNDQIQYRKKLLASFKDNEKRFYGYIRRLQTRPVEVTQLKKSDGKTTSTDLEVAEELGMYFHEVYTREDTPLQPMNDDKLLTHEPFVDSVIDLSPEMVKSVLSKLQPNKAPGPDGLHPMMLRECANELAYPVSKIYAESFDSGILPTDWKSANISPIFKKGCKADPANYRPVALTSVLCKVMERLLRIGMLNYLEHNGLLSQHQHGFTRKRSCLTNLLETFEAWTDALDTGYGVDVVYLDFRKAFDTVPIQRLLYKLRYYGIEGRLYNWIEDFLTARKTRVNVRGSWSRWREVLSGVPQGSVLGPILFLIFVNDLPDWMKCSIKLFADDTKIWNKISKKEDQEELQEDLDSMMKWSDRWLLRLHLDKCKVMHIGHQVKTKYYLQGSDARTELTETTEERDLGVQVTNKLKVTAHCAKAAAKANAVTGIIRRHFKRLNRKDFVLLYKTYVRPHLEYCVQAWSPSLKKDIKLLEAVQQRATKLVEGFKGLTYEVRLQKLGLTTLEKRRIRGDLIETYKLLTSREGIGFEKFFSLAHSEYGLRGHSLKLKVERSRLDVRKNFYSQRVVKEWNGLPQFVIESATVNGFKNRLDNYWNRHDMSH